MKTTIFILWSIMCFTVFLSFLQAAAVEEFTSPQLDKKLWEMKSVEKASYEIKDGVLDMVSPSLESGIMLYFNRDIEELDITFEVKFDASGIVDNIVIGSIAQIMEPQLNDNINNNLEATLFFTPANCYIKQDPVVIGQKPPNPAGLETVYEKEWNVIEITFSEANNKVSFVVNGKELGEVDKNNDVKSRYFYVTPDPYASHYTGEMKVEYIKISGPGSAVLSVRQLDKLATTWAKIKI